ncbi:MAG: tRNA (N6-threonylcarbamoyladenosine(37)-N6)-methyltransferase TrmO [Planctomycetes bacterium GWF2_41_51]|nr:MAG: tRNA (N6-threonylcarbamoyladenosine(37)-N6)-methyltransferase TrmO [Planctomycetes bacterium GWF2_41_51]
MGSIKYKSIGIIHTPFADDNEIPRQSTSAFDISGHILLFKKYTKGLMDLDKFSHIMVIFHLHLVTSKELVSHPPWDKKLGIFSTCSPYRPNPIGISIVKLNKIRKNKLYISGIDMADGTPVLDIKPYIPSLYPKKNIIVGWDKEKINIMKTGKSKIIR